MNHFNGIREQIILIYLLINNKDFFKKKPKTKILCLSPRHKNIYNVSNLIKKTSRKRSELFSNFDLVHVSQPIIKRIL